MFTAATFQLIRNNCQTEFDTLLKKISISKPDWSGDEYRIYEQLDNDITRKICAAMKSSSVIEGYTNLFNILTDFEDFHGIKIKNVRDLKKINRINYLKCLSAIDNFFVRACW